jgi:hypothetical protein
MASSYDNDLRLNEMATGDGSGTWGTTTNTNLELIAEAFSYGTEVITTNADTHTTTIADGATDPGRSLYLKYTGTLDSACTITIAPNDISKVWIIENGTSGSQNIIISQGSGANITIPAGDTKVVYSDGAGAGAAFFDAFASLNVVDLKVQDDLTVTDDASIGGDATITGTLGVTGVFTGTSLDISGDIDVDGTTNLDVVDIDGAVDMATTLAVAGNVDFNGDLDVDGTTNLDIVDIDGAVDMASTLAVTGVVTANAGFHINSASYDNRQAGIDAGGFYIYNAADSRYDLQISDIGGLSTTPAAGGHAIFNEGGVDADFRVESDGNANMLVVDGGNNCVGIGSPSAAAYGTMLVEGTGNVLNVNASSGAATFQIYEAGSGRFGITTLNGSTGAKFTLAGAEVMRITSAGDFGILTSFPAAPLHVNGTLHVGISGVNANDVTGTLNIGNTGTYYMTQIKAINVGATPSILQARMGFFTLSGTGETVADSTEKMSILAGNGNVGIGTTTPASKLTVNGSLSKSSGSFRIDHPLEAKSTTHDLVHSFVEAPQADNIYRGKVDLVNGSATVNIDTVAGMTEGTFVALNREVQCFTTNEANWDAVKGSVSGNILTIESENSESTATISWLVIGERQDQHMYDTEWTDDDGKVIVEPIKS